MPTARTKANQKYNEKAYDRFLLTVSKGEKDKIKKFAESKGKSLNGYICELIRNDMKEELK